MAMSDYAKAAHNKADRERYYWLKEHGLCTKCGQNYAEAGHVTCKNCYKKQRDWVKRTDPDRSKQRAREQARRERLRQAGLCLWCGKQKAVEGRSLCRQCKEKYNETQIKYNIHQRTLKGDKQWEP